MTDGLGHTTTTQYDALNRATTITSPVSGGTTVIAYDAAGREISLTDPDNNKTQWAYDVRRSGHDRDLAQFGHGDLCLRQ